MYSVYQKLRRVAKDPPQITKQDIFDRKRSLVRKTGNTKLVIFSLRETLVNWDSPDPDVELQITAHKVLAVKFRPFLETMLEATRKKYEIAVFSD
jgi:hypothetical protein